MKTIQVTHTPKKAVASYEVKDYTDLELLNEILGWVLNNLRGTFWWRKTLFRNPLNAPRHVQICQQKHFDPNVGYWVYQFWFSHKSDAAIFVISWDISSRS